MSGEMIGWSSSGAAWQDLVDIQSCGKPRVHTQSQSVELPCSKIIRAVDSNASTFLLLFSLVLAEPKVFPSNLIPCNTPGVGIDVVAVRVAPSTTWSNPFGRCEGSQQSADKDRSDGRHAVDLSVLTELQQIFERIHVLSDILLQPRDILPKSRLYQDVHLRLHLGRRRRSGFSVTIVPWCSTPQQGGWHY
jgi:hypothetical protein